jgi:hypothetical protein
MIMSTDGMLGGADVVVATNESSIILVGVDSDDLGLATFF